MNDTSGFGEANQDLLSANATRANEQGAGMTQILAGGQGADGSGTVRQADVITSNLNSSEGSQQGSTVNGGTETAGTSVLRYCFLCLVSTPYSPCVL